MRRISFDITTYHIWCNLVHGRGALMRGKPLPNLEKQTNDYDSTDLFFVYRVLVLVLDVVKKRTETPVNSSICFYNSYFKFFVRFRISFPRKNEANTFIFFYFFRGGGYGTRGGRLPHFLQEIKIGFIVKR